MEKEWSYDTVRSESEHIRKKRSGMCAGQLKCKVMLGMLAAAGAGMLLSGCGKKKEETLPEPEPQTVVEDTTPEEDETPDTLIEEETQIEEEDLHEGEAKSYLTGEWVNEKLAKRRPISCMIGNTDSALPQYGLSLIHI